MLPEERCSACFSYQVRGILGKGGMSVVYLVRCEQDGRDYALKQSFTDAISRQQVREEGRLLTMLSYPAFPSVKEIWETEACVYLVMSYITGYTLSQWMEENPLQNRKDFVPDGMMSWICQLADCLEFLHQRCIIYCDLKPSNVMLNSQGKLFLVDFGAAREQDAAYQEVSGAGTPGFAPPEQYRVDWLPEPWTDIYSFGVLLHFLLTGMKPTTHLFQLPDLRRGLAGHGELQHFLTFTKGRQIRRWNQLIRRCTAYEPARRCDWPQIRRMLRCLDRRAHCRIFVRFRRRCLGVMGLFLMTYFGMRWIHHQSNLYLYESSLTKAKVYDTDTEMLILNAIGQLPGDARAYLALYAYDMRDDRFSKAEAQQMRRLVLKYADDRLFERPEWLILSYKMGMAIYLQSDDIPEWQAAFWFQKIIEADIEKMDFGDDETRKMIWQKRAAIFVKWCQQDAADMDFSLFWMEVDALLADGFCQEEMAWELGIYDRILTCLMGEMMPGIREHLISEAQIITLLDRMHEQLMYVFSDGENGERIQRILDKEKVIRKRLLMTGKAGYVCGEKCINEKKSDWRIDFTYGIRNANGNVPYADDRFGGRDGVADA